MYKKDVVINADGRGYYEYLPALFIYNDIRYNYLDTLETDYYKPEQTSQYYVNSAFENKVNKYFAGTAFLQSPFFAFAHFKTKSQLSEYSADGFSKPYQRSIFYSGIFYLFLGLVFIRKLLETYTIKWWWIVAFQVFTLFNTSLITYSLYDPAYSHVYSFAIISGFLFFVRKYFLTKNSSFILLAFLFLGIILILRPVNLLVILFIPFLADSWTSLLENLNHIFRKSWKMLLLGSILFIGVLSIQFSVSYLQTGNILSYNYGDEGFNFLSPRFFDFLFSYRKGFFLWSPWWFVIFLTATFFWIKSKKYYQLLSFLIAFTVLVYVLSSWWYWSYGGSHGSRPMVDFYGAFSLLAIPIYKSGKKFIYGTIILLSIPLTIINLVQTYQYQRAIIHWDGMDKESYWEMFLKTDKRYGWYLWRRNVSVGKKQSEMTLYRDIHVESTHSKDIGIVEIDIINSQSEYGQFILTLDRFVDAESMDIRAYSINHEEIWYKHIPLFGRHKENKVIFTTQLPKNKLDFHSFTVTIREVKEPLKVKELLFSTHYAL